MASSTFKALCVVMFLIGMVSVINIKQKSKIKESSTKIETLEKCVETLEKIHLINDQTGEIIHASIKVTTETLPTAPVEGTRRPVLSE